MTAVSTGGGWVPEQCTLPTAEQPMRQADFIDLLGRALSPAAWLGEHAFEVRLPVAIEERARALAAAESECCTFFEFTFDHPEPSVVSLRIAVPAGQERVLVALAAMVVPGGES